MITAIIDLLEGRKPKVASEDSGNYESPTDDNWKADEEGNLKLQKTIRKKMQQLDDPNEPYGYRKGKKDTILAHALRMDFGKEDDARKQKSPEHIANMLNARKAKMNSYKKNL